MTPDAIILDDGNTYELDSTEMKFAFSTYGHSGLFRDNGQQRRRDAYRA